jgi:hypothetical protein
MLIHSSSRETSDGFCIPKRHNTPSVNFIIILESAALWPFPPQDHGIKYVQRKR